MGFSLGSILPIAGAAIGGYYGGSSGAAVGGTIGQGIGGQMAASDAASQQQASINQAIAYNQALYKSSLNQLAPYQAAGSTSMNQLMALLGMGGQYGTNLKNLQASINAPPPVDPNAGGDNSHMGIFDSIKNLADPANFFHSGGGSFLGNFFDPGNVVGGNPKAGNPNPYTKLGGEAVGAYFGGGALAGLLAKNQSGSSAASSGGGRAMGGPTQGGSQGQSFVVGEEGPEVLHMFPGAKGYVTPNPGTMTRMAGGRALGGPVTGGPNVGMGGMDPSLSNFHGLAQGLMHLGMPTMGQGPFRQTTGPGSGGAPPAAAIGSANPGTQGFNPYASNQNAHLTGGQTSAQVLKQDPSYQFQLQQGIQAIDHSAAAQGGLLTGGHLKDLMTFGQGLASQDFNNIYNRLMSVTSLGLGASSTAGQFGLFTGSNNGGLMTAGGQAGAQGGIAGFNAMSGALGNLFSGSNGGSMFGGLFGGGGGSSYSGDGGITMPNGGFSDGQPGG